MPDWALAVILVLLVVNAAMVIALLLRGARDAERLDDIRTGISTLTGLNERIERSAREDSETDRRAAAEAALALRTQFRDSARDIAESVAGQLDAASRLQAARLEAVDTALKTQRESADRELAAVRKLVDDRLSAIQQDNADKLEKIRAAVDERLEGTLERRLGESFKLVSERLEQVHKGLGEMQSLSAGVTDLKRVMSNVKARGVWGEWQLAALLQEMLAPGQYVANAQVKPSSAERVEFAVRLPGADDDGPVLLPIDSKFPQEDYQRLVAAMDAGDAEAVRAAGAELEMALKRSAKEIRDKYIAPPRTTEFAIMFLPTESLFAEALRRPGLVESLQRDLRVAVAGPTTLAAYLNSLQMGFRTLAVQKRSGEVWSALGDIRKRFDAFGELLVKVQRKLGEATDTIADATKRTDQIRKRLNSFETAGETGAQATGPALPWPADQATLSDGRSGDGRV